MRIRTIRTPWLAALLVLAATTQALGARGHLNLLGQILPPGMDEICDVWGYVDPSGIDYAIIGDWGMHPLGGGIYIINVEDPTNPFVAKAIIGSGRYGFDAKVWDHYIYTCNGSASGVTSRVYDISDIQNPIESAAFNGTHNFEVHPDGYLYASVSGLVAYDIHTNPMSPTPVWITDLTYGHDTWPVGNILYDFHGYGGTRIYDITNRTSPVLLGSINDPSITYHHSGCPTPDGKYLYLCDELATNTLDDFSIWDISNPATPVRVGGWKDTGATVHNLYIIGDLAFVSYYSAGARIFDVSDPVNPVLLDTYDTSASTGENYDGCFGMYPYAGSGVVYATDFDNGLFLFSVDGFTPPATSVGDGAGPPVARLAGNHPNPFNPSTTISYELNQRMPVTLSVYDARGRRIRTLVHDVESAGAHDARWDGVDESGARVASGVYFARLVAGTHSESSRMVLLK